MGELKIVFQENAEETLEYLMQDMNAIMDMLGDDISCKDYKEVIRACMNLQSYCRVIDNIVTNIMLINGLKGG